KDAARGSAEIKCERTLDGKSTRVMGAQHDSQLARRYRRRAAARGTEFGVMERKRKSFGARSRIGKHRMVSLRRQQLFRSAALDGRLRRVLPEAWVRQANHTRPRCCRPDAGRPG